MYENPDDVVSWLEELFLPRFSEKESIYEYEIGCFGFYLCRADDRPGVVPAEAAVALLRPVLDSDRRVFCPAAAGLGSVRVPR